MPITADHGYMISLGVDLVLDDGQLRASPRQRTSGAHVEINLFLRGDSSPLVAAASLGLTAIM